jgi:hypothetical protein
VQGKSRELVAEAGTSLGLDGTYTPHSFIEQVQLSHLMSEFKEATSEFQDALSLDVNTTALPEVGSPPLFKFRNNAQLAAQLAASISHVALIGPN